MSADVATFEIARDESAGGGFQVATLRSSSPEEPSSVVIGGVSSGGPAALAGMLEEHIGWHIIEVDGNDVDVETCLILLDATRSPGHTFSLTVRRPRTGDLTIDSDLTARRHVNVEDIEDIRMTIDENEDGHAVVRFSMPSQLAMAMGLTPEAAEQFWASMLQSLGLYRQRLDPAEIEKLKEEEERAGEKDIDPEDESHRCIICFSKQRAILFLPCRHFATCHRCTVIVHRMGKCPLCRQQIDGVKDAQELDPSDLRYTS